MSKTLNDEQRVDIRRREQVKSRPQSAIPHVPLIRTPLPEPIPLPLDEPLPRASTPVQEPAAQPQVIEPAPRPAPAAEIPAPVRASQRLDGIGYAHRWYSTLTFFTAFGLTLGVVTIIRTGFQRTRTAQAPRPALLAKAPLSQEPPVQVMQAAAVQSIPADPAPTLIIEPPPAPPARVQRIRDPFTAALRRTPQDEALEEATRVYSMMEVALRDAVTVLPAAAVGSPSSSTPVIQSE
jgi:hypothetical protein